MNENEQREEAELSQDDQTQAFETRQVYTKNTQNACWILSTTSEQGDKRIHREGEENYPSAKFFSFKTDDGNLSRATWRVWNYVPTVTDTETDFLHTWEIWEVWA